METDDEASARVLIVVLLHRSLYVFSLQWCHRIDQAACSSVCLSVQFEPISPGTEDGRDSKFGGNVLGVTGVRVFGQKDQSSTSQASAEFLNWQLVITDSSAVGFNTCLGICSAPCSTSASSSGPTFEERKLSSVDETEISIISIALFFLHHGCM